MIITHDFHKVCASELKILLQKTAIVFQIFQHLDKKLNGVQTFTVTCFTQYNFTRKFQIKLQKVSLYKTHRT